MEAPMADRLATAVAALAQRGEGLSVRNLRRKAGCSTDAARQYLATMRVDDVPEQKAEALDAAETAESKAQQAQEQRHQATAEAENLQQRGVSEIMHQ